MFSRQRVSAPTTRRLTRRRFLQGVTLASAPLLIPSQVFGAAGTPGANNRVHIGVIGTGIRGKHLVGDMPADGRVIALCDCFLPRVHQALKPDPTSDVAATLQGFTEHDAASCAAYADYRKMIDAAKLDAVIITTPDHHHVQAATLACQAVLDVYCEKPLTLRS